MNNYTIYIQSKEKTGEKYFSALEQVAIAALKHQNAPSESWLTLVLSNNTHLKALNYEFMGIDHPTDVLSFPNETILPMEDGMPKGPYLGDVIMSVQKAKSQAQIAKHSMLRELQLLTIHGILHLLGHDHAEIKEKKQMWQAQEEIWRQTRLTSQL